MKIYRSKCEWCGEVFEYEYKGGRKRKYCSPTCYQKANNSMKEKKPKIVTRNKTFDKDYAERQKAETIEKYTRVRV